jgi:hypothetical protein
MTNAASMTPDMTRLNNNRRISDTSQNRPRKGAVWVAVKARFTDLSRTLCST